VTRFLSVAFALSLVGSVSDEHRQALVWGSQETPYVIDAKRDGINPDELTPNS
jgi:hypothetical protein